MGLSCTGGDGRVLIEQRFLRPLARAERERLEAHLSACVGCSERYRRLQLAERLAAGGPGAAGEPAPQELERIAADLGLSEHVAPSWRERLAGLRTPRWAPVALAAAAGAALVIAILPGRSGSPPGPRGGELVERGTAPPPVSFAPYALAADGSAARALGASGTVAPGELLKLRAALGAGIGPEQLRGVLVVIAAPGESLAAAAPRGVVLRPPAREAFFGPEGATAASVPGAVPFRVPPGRARVLVIALASDVTPAEVGRLLEGASTATGVAARLGGRALAVELLEVEVEVEVAP